MCGECGVDSVGDDEEEQHDVANVNRKAKMNKQVITGPVSFSPHHSHNVYTVFLKSSLARKACT